MSTMPTADSAIAAATKLVDEAREGDRVDAIGAVAKAILQAEFDGFMRGLESTQGAFDRAVEKVLHA